MTYNVFGGTNLGLLNCDFTWHNTPCRWPVCYFGICDSVDQ